VNIAARLESLAEAGGVCISGTAYDQVERKLGLQYEYLGEQTVKNIDRPVRVYRVLSVPGAAAHRVVRAKRVVERKWRRTALLAGALVLVAVAVVATWPIIFPPKPKPPPPLSAASPPPTTPSPPPAAALSPQPVAKADVNKMAFPLPDKPSIAVLPFANMSKDPDQEYFCDGMTEDLITDLSKISGFFVIARNSTFVFKGKSVEIVQVAEKLGVRYVLEGSVRRHGDDVRINAQLIDAITGGHVWSERYDGTMKGIFALQDKINQKIVAALAVKLTEGERAQVVQKGTDSLAAYDEYLKGRAHSKRFTNEDFEKAEACYKRALELDPKFTRVRAGLASLHYARSSMGFGKKGLTGLLEDSLWARHYLREAMREPTPMAHVVAGRMDLRMRRHDAAIARLEKALSLDPNDPGILGHVSFALSLAGRPAESIEYAKRAMRLDPINPTGHLYNIGLAHFCMGEWEKAATVLDSMVTVSGGLILPTLALLAPAYVHLGQEEKARTMIENYTKIFKEVLGYSPSLTGLMSAHPFKDRRVAEFLAEGLLKAGLPGRLSDYIHVTKEDQLTEQDLRALAGTTSVGVNPLGSQWFFQQDKDGDKGIYRGPPWGLAEGVSWTGEDNGKVRYEGDMQCIQYEKSLWGMEVCQVVYRNPRGTPEGKNEYVAFSDLGMDTWSLVR
jgi:adenylate cyclase